MDAKNREWIRLIERKTEHLRSAFIEKGMTGLCKTIQNELDSWKNETINIGVLGEAEAGKSTYINALRNLDADEPGGAPVGNTNMTSKIRSYDHPNNKNVHIWDFPGVGSTNNPKDGYLEKIEFAKFDFFIIMTSKRFSENDIWLAREIKKKRKKFYFVRTQFEDDVENEMEKKENKEIQKKDLESILKQKVYEDCKRNLEEFKCEDNIFVIDSYVKSSYDFEKLETHLIHDAFNISDGKHLAITSCLTVMTLPSLKEKKLVLEKRIPKIALRAAFALRVKDTDIMILKEEMEFYKQQFNLNERSLRRDAEVSNIMERLSKIEESVQHIEKESNEMEELNEIDKLMPFLPVINIRKTYKASKTLLQKALERIYEKAVDVNLTMMEGLTHD
ncbi:interferon-gamma-inducible GTPase 10-like [Ruditapes philippinarum]|uniref:interferon-gamma-inducible GTPase 10-like n=1 Tax=Ruditapes philippinarum TaxID=129788 RepID=UPI00295A6709|nr:interferon-gamma-inducible GTPase 10-like [Ruditapes philippinarum]